MKLRIGALVAVAVVAAAYFSDKIALPFWHGSFEDKVVSIASEDVEMNAAIAKARATLPDFWSKFASPASNEEGFALKLGISEGDETEHFWCNNIKGNAEKASCEINNEPVTVHSVKLGQRVDVDSAIISDWMYTFSGKIKGGQTIRALLPHLAGEEAEMTKAMLADE